MIHLVRVGVMAQVGRFRSLEGELVERGSRVVLRTPRGLEVGEVLGHDGPAAEKPDGALLRRLSVADDLLIARLEKNRHEAYTACQELLTERGSQAVLIDVEHLFDGRGLYFYFLGEVDPETESLTNELAKAYDAEAQFGQFADALSEGCGPGCGTEDAVNGCGSSGGCATCSIASACSTKG